MMQSRESTKKMNMKLTLACFAVAASTLAWADALQWQITEGVKSNLPTPVKEEIRPAATNGTAAAKETAADAADADAFTLGEKEEILKACRDLGINIDPSAADGMLGTVKSGGKDGEKIISTGTVSWEMILDAAQRGGVYGGLFTTYNNQRDETDFNLRRKTK